MSENRASPPTAEFLDSIHSTDLEELNVAAATVSRRHKELRALSLWLVEYDGYASTDREDILEKERIIQNIAATFFVGSSEQVQALTDDYEERVFIEGN